MKNSEVSPIEAGEDILEMLKHLKREFGGFFQRCTCEGEEASIWAPPDNVKIAVLEPLQYGAIVDGKPETRVLWPGIYLTGSLNDNPFDKDCHSLLLLSEESYELTQVFAGGHGSETSSFWEIDWRKVIRIGENPKPRNGSKRVVFVSADELTRSFLIKTAEGGYGLKAIACESIAKAVETDELVADLAIVYVCPSDIRWLTGAVNDLKNKIHCPIKLVFCNEKIQAPDIDLWQPPEGVTVLSSEETALAVSLELTQLARAE